MKYLYVEVDVNAYYNPNLASNAAAVKTVLTNNINSYADSAAMNKYGAKFRYSKFQTVVDNSNESITSNITKVTIRRDMKPLLNQAAEYELCFGNPFYIKNTNGYNIQSSGFTIFGQADTLYLGDKPAADKRTGSLFFFRLQSRNNPVVVKTNVGTVYYNKGEILLKPITLTGTSKKIQEMPIIEVSACPQSNDVIGLQDLYLQLDVSKSTVDMVTDTVGSGEGSSGSNYTATSSYIRGDIARLTEEEGQNTSLHSSDTYVLGGTIQPELQGNPTAPGATPATTSSSTAITPNTSTSSPTY